MGKERDITFENRDLQNVSALVPAELLILCNKLSAQRILEDRPYTLSQFVREGLTLLINKELKRGS